MVGTRYHGEPSAKHLVLRVAKLHNGIKSNERRAGGDIPSSRFCNRRLVRLLDPGVVQSIQRHLELPPWPPSLSIGDDRVKRVFVGKWFDQDAGVVRWCPECRKQRIQGAIGKAEPAPQPSLHGAIGPADGVGAARLRHARNMERICRRLQQIAGRPLKIRQLRVLFRRRVGAPGCGRMSLKWSSSASNTHDHRQPRRSTAEEKKTE
jgi:hypothetical protein